MRLRLPPGIFPDAPAVATPDDLRVARSNNWRWRRSRAGADAPYLETVGPAFAVASALPAEPFSYSDAFSPDFDRAAYPGSQILLPYLPHTLAHVSLSGGPATIVAGLNRVDLLQPQTGDNPLFSLAAAPLWVLPGATPAYAPSGSGRYGTATLPAWWFVEDYDLVIGGHIGAGPAYSWNKNPATPFAVQAAIPAGAVGAAISNRILVLLGVAGVADPALAALTVRWSDRFDFTEFTPSDLNVSGELVLEGGSRIVGGGMSSFGILVWTDRVLAVLTESPAGGLVFSREYVAGAAGLLSPRAWCECAGEIWWLDPDWNLWRYDGGRPRRVPCPAAEAMFGGVDYPSLAPWVQLVPQPGYDEVWVAYRNGFAGTGANRVLAYSYALDAWYPFTFFGQPGRRGRDLFTAFAPASAGLQIMSAFRVADDTAVLSLHDMVDAVDADDEVFAGDTSGPPAVLCRPWTHFLETAPFVLTEDVQDETVTTTRVHLDARVNPLAGTPPAPPFSCDPCAAEPDAQMQVTVTGMRRGERTFSVETVDTRPWRVQYPQLDFRVSGRYLRFRIEHGGADRRVPQATGRVRVGGVWFNAKGGGTR